MRKMAVSPVTFPAPSACWSPPGAVAPVLSAPLLACHPGRTSRGMTCLPRVGGGQDGAAGSTRPMACPPAVRERAGAVAALAGTHELGHAVSRTPRTA